MSEPCPSEVLELRQGKSRNVDKPSIHRPSSLGLPEEGDSPPIPVSQGVPPELKNLLAEIVFVLTCSAGQLIASLTVGNILVTQDYFREALDVSPTQVPWFTESALSACGLSVIVSGSLADLAPPKPLMVGDLLW